MTQCGSAATEEDPPNDAKNAKGSGSKVGSPASVLFGVIWRVWRIISFRQWGRQNGRVKKSSQNAIMNKGNEDCKARRKETLFSWLPSVQSLLGRAQATGGED